MSSETLALKFQVGPTGLQGDGTEVEWPRTDRFGSLRSAWGAAAHEEYVGRGECYAASNQAEITFGTALTETAVTFTLYNPVGSPVDLVLLHIGITVRTSSTAGHLVLAANTNAFAAIPATNTELIVRNMKLDGAAGYAKVFSVTTLPAAPVAIRALGFGCVTALANCGKIEDKVNGAVVLGPNTAVTVQGITIAGTGIISMMWKERRRIA